MLFALITGDFTFIILSVFNKFLQSGRPFKFFFAMLTVWDTGIIRRNIYSIVNSIISRPFYIKCHLLYCQVSSFDCRYEGMRTVVLSIRINLEMFWAYFIVHLGLCSNISLNWAKFAFLILNLFTFSSTISMITWSLP